MFLLQDTTIFSTDINITMMQMLGKFSSKSIRGTTGN
jgi:hypothetical protein